MFFEDRYWRSWLLNQLKLWVIRPNFWNCIRFFLLKILKSRSWKHSKGGLAFLLLFLFYSNLDFTLIEIFFRHLFPNSLYIRHHVYFTFIINLLHPIMNTLRLYLNSLIRISPHILHHYSIFLFLLLILTWDHSQQFISQHLWIISRRIILSCHNFCSNMFSFL